MSQEPEQGGFGFDAGSPDHDRLRAFDADFTPGPIVGQGLEWLDRHAFRERAPDHILDPSAGSGVFGQQEAQRWPRAELVGLEPREEEFEHLRRNYCRACQTRFEAWMPDVIPDLIATNPPFSLFPEFVELGHRFLPQHGILMLLGLSTWGQSAEGGALFERFPPWFQLRIGGRIGFRGPGNNPKTGKPWGVDQRDYSWWLWGMGVETPTFGGIPYWRTLQLPVLSAAQRTWRIKPGTEAPKALTERAI